VLPNRINVDAVAMLLPATGSPSFAVTVAVFVAIV
jgi:hypothetical protein